MNLDWDAKKYSTDFSYVHEYGADLLDLIDGRGGRVLDLGCGNGALTRKLSEAGFHAEGMDNSESLLCAARASYPELPFFLGDAADFHPEEPYDIVFSNAVFHWIPRERQRDMLRCIYDALHRHGQLVFEMGGSGNVRKILGGFGTVSTVMSVFLNAPSSSRPSASTRPFWSRPASRSAMPCSLSAPPH